MVNFFEPQDIDWTMAGADNQQLSRDVVMALIQANTSTDAENAAWKVEDVICRNQGLYDIALPVLKIILSSYPDMSFEAKQASLGLLVQIAFSESVQSESTKELCLYELLYSSWYFFRGLQFDDEALKSDYIDILLVLSEKFDFLIPRVKGCL